MPDAGIWILDADVVVRIGLFVFSGLGVGCEWQSGGLDVSQLPCEEHAQKEHNRQSDAGGECPGHAFAACLVVAFSAHHVEERATQAGQDGDEG